MTRIATIRMRALGAIVATVLLAACGSGSPTARPAATSTRPAVETNASVISVATKMICGDEGQEDIEKALGTRTTEPPMPTWVDHTYACRYAYPHGVMRLSVKQLGSAGATDVYFRELAHRLGRRTTLDGLGEGAFTTRSASVVVRKDFKVLLVDITKLPAQFGLPAAPRSDVAINVAQTIMSCWTGA
jgi:hypothetical protein